MTKRALVWIAVSTKAQADEEDAYSLPIQEADAQALAAQQGWRIVDVLRVPGHSRHYIDIHECATDMLKEGIDAFDKLLKHWKARDFDVLIVRDGNRFARTQTLHAYVTEMTIRQGAVLWSLSDGLVNDNNFRLWISMNGYKAGSEVDTLVRRRKEVVRERAKRGIIAHSAVPSTHIVIRDPSNGKALRMVVDETQRRFWQDAAALILEGVAWNNIEHELFERFGHANSRGEPHQPVKVYSLIRNPVFWGNIALGHRPRAKDTPWAKFGDWIVEPGHPIPEGVTIYYGVCEPVLTGDLADAVKAEVRRRSIVVVGGTSPSKTHPFTGVFVCLECGYYLSSFGAVRALGRKPGYLKCMSHWHKSATRGDCSQRKALRVEQARDHLDKRLREMLAAEDPEAFLGAVNPAQAADQLTLLADEIAAAEARIRRLIQKQASADDVLHDLYADELRFEAEALKRRRARLAELERGQHSTARLRGDRRAAYDEVVRLSVEVFWQQSDRFINQILLKLMGDVRLAVVEGEIKELVDKPPPPHLRRIE